MVDSIASLPYYEQWTPGAVPSAGRTMTVNWWAHLTEDLLIVHLVDGLYLLKRQHYREVHGHFNVIGELRSVDQPVDEVFEMVLKGNEEKKIDYIREWQALPLAAEVVFHVMPRTLNLRYQSEWARLSQEQCASVAERTKYLHLAPTPVASFCLGATSPMALHRLAFVLRTFAKTIGMEESQGVIETLENTLADLGLRVSLLGSAEWCVAEPDSGQPEKLLGCIRAKVAHPDAAWAPVRGGVVCFGVGETDKRPCYLGVTRSGALSDRAVTTYNTGTRGAIANEKAQAQQADESKAFLMEKWPLFAVPPPGPIYFPQRRELRKQYICGLTKFAKLIAADDPMRMRRHPQGCLCPWITKVKELLDCAWCGKELNGPEQFCDHLFGDHHQKQMARVEKSIERDDDNEIPSVTEAVEAVEKATQEVQQAASAASRQEDYQTETGSGQPLAETQERWQQTPDWRGSTTWWDNDSQDKNDTWCHPAARWYTLPRDWQASSHWEKRSHQCSATGASWQGAWQEGNWPSRSASSSSRQATWQETQMSEPQDSRYGDDDDWDWHWRR